MAAGNPLHQPSGDGSGLEANQKRLNPALLPYEKDLIQLLGCSEAEYKELFRFNQLLKKARPAEYDHIPDVVNDPVTAIVVNLVIGLALTAASVLLAPKPQIDDQQDRKRVRQEQLPNDVGPSRFNQTSSFDGFASLVDYGIPVPIAFGKMVTSGSKYISGGLVLAASLVWSRAYSYGTYQRVKLLYTLGQYILAQPIVRGVWLGTQSLSALGGSEYALYWKSESGDNRIQKTNLIGGTRGTPEAGDPETQTETFIAPVDGTIEGPGFCMVNNPQSKAQFGQFNPVRNGTGHRINWEVISIPFDALKDDPQGPIDGDNIDADGARRARAERIKVAGEFAGIIFDAGLGGQPGVGRAYGTRMGLVAYAPPGGGFIETNDKIPFVDIAPDYQVKFRINGGNWEEFDKTGYVYAQDGTPRQWSVTHKDLTSAMDSRRARADDLFSIGSRWMIGPTQWLVVSRTNQVWRPGTEVEVILKCVSTTGLPRIGLAGLRAATEPLGGYEGPWNTTTSGGIPKPANINDKGFNIKKHCGAAFWNLVQYEVATARMTRLADTVEFGIKSTVWNQANGLCNFNAIPTPEDLFKKDSDNINVNTPTTSRYFKRTSCFSIFVRPIPQFEDLELSPPEWKRLNPVFCVTGDSPRAMYNYIRIRPRVVGLYEFRFIPRVGSDIAINSDPDVMFYQLNAAGGEVIGEDFGSPYGDFRVTITGQKIECKRVLFNEELVSNPAKVQAPPPEDTKIPTAISNYAWSTGADWHKNAWLTEFLGNPSFNGQTGTATTIHQKIRGPGSSDDGYIKVQIQATASNISGPRHLSNFGTNLNWAGNGSSIRFSVIQDSDTKGQWANGDQFTITKSISSSNRYYPWNPGSVGAAFQVTNVKDGQASGDITFDDGERAFEEASQVSDCSHYDEISKSCDSGPEHEIVYLNNAVSEADGEGDGIPQYEDLAMLGMSLKSGPAIGAIEQPRVWVNGGIGVTRLANSDVFGVSNLLSDLLYYLLKDDKQGLGEIIPDALIDKASFAETGKYLQQNGIYWNGVVESDQNFRNFATDQAQKNLCIFTIKNGVFGMMPALPVNSAQAISTDSIAADGAFAQGNIIDGSFKLTFIGAEERRPSALQVRWRRTLPYELPEELTAVVQFAGTNPETIEDYDLTQFCDNDAQALMTARFALASRRFIDHTVEFKTTPEAVGVQPGSYIKVFMEETEFQTGLALRINDDLTITSPTAVEDGTYKISAYLPGGDGVIETEMVLIDQRVQDANLRGAIASIYSTSPYQRVYQITELTLDEDGLVNISASVVPTQSDGSSTIAFYTLNANQFTVTR